ncbi:4Fe-4S cluster-binding domain-containing protein [Streptomyces longwoodensis]|uniref:4Fe-4S cluster-binding domain-containing protein n=1 Tax=Streptomyces longwoodensis TaxID=68231 RepID=UPI0033A79894
MADAHFPVATLGPGRRLVLWLQGCALACPGCMSRHTWDAAGGYATTVGDLLRLWDEALAEEADGLTVSGGEPLAQPAALAALLRGAAGLRHRYGDRGREADLLVYTGYEPGEVADTTWGALEGVDAVVTGRFRVTEPTDLVWRGSANQSIRPRTPLGDRRYGPHLGRTHPPGPRVALRVDGTSTRVYGVPAPGELRRLEQSLAAAGIRLTDPSWRP